MASIGIGITTYNRPEMLKKCLEHIKKHTFNDNVTIYVADDSNERKGVAYRKNECLRALKDCDHIFLFDDDIVHKYASVKCQITKKIPYILYNGELAEIISLPELENKIIDNYEIY